jgi:adenosylcobyric acid synthase
LTRNGAAVLATEHDDGAMSAGGNVVGTMLHGVFDNDAVRACLLGELTARRGLPVRRPSPGPSREEVFDRLADTVRAHIDMSLLRRLSRLPSEARAPR